MKTGWPPGLLQDDDRGLSKWLAGRPDARYQVRKNIMTTQTEAQLIADALDDEFAQGRISNHTGRKAAAELRRLEAANTDLLAALKMNAQALSWLAFGECRGFTDDLPTAIEATDAASAAIAKHGGAA